MGEITDPKAFLDRIQRHLDGADGATSNLHDVEMEQALLGAILLNNNLLHEIGEDLKPAHFHAILHARLYECAVNTVSRGETVTPQSLAALFVNDAALAHEGGIHYLAQLVAECPSTKPDVVHDYARIIARLAAKRGLERVALETLDAVRRADWFTTPNEIAAQTEQAMAAVMAGQGAQSSTLTRGGDAALQAIEEAWQAKQQGKRPGLRFWLDDVDQALGGIHPGDLGIVAARPGMGKSAFAGCAARAIASEAGVYIASCEMTAAQLGRRLATDAAYDMGYAVSYSQMRSGDLDRATYDILREAHREIENLPLIIDDKRNPSISHIRASARRAAVDCEKRGVPLGLIIVDHIQLIDAGDRYRGNRVQEVTEITKALKTMAQEFRCGVMALSQLNRAVEGREDRRPGLADLRESGSIEQDADWVLMLYRPEYYLLQKRPDRYQEPEAYATWEPKYERAKNRMEIGIVKAREGATDPVIVSCEMRSSAIRNMRKSS